MTDTNYYKDNYIFGLDIGTRTIVGLVGYPTAGGLNIIAGHILEHDTRAMIDGQIHDVEKVTQSIKKVKSELEKKIGFPLKKACIAAAGRVLRTKIVHVEQAVDPNIVIDEDRIFSIELLGIEKAHQEINLNLSDNDSGYHCVGYTISKYYLNDYEISKLLGHKGKKIGADILATFLPKEVVESLYQVIGSADMEVQSLTLEPIAAINVAIPGQYRLLNIALVDIGAGTSDIAITKDGSIIAYGMIPYAGDEITEAIVHEYLVDFKTAEMIKIKASGKSKSISYKDIIGITHKVSAEEILQKVYTTVEKLAALISEKIKELNGLSTTNAVFLVGGGGQIKGFTDLLAEKLDLSKERVALRGKEVLDAINFAENIKKSPELVTPIGICFSGLDEHKRDFMQVYLNDEPIKVFDTNNLTVMDIAAFKNINPKDLIARRGKDLTFIFNEHERIIKGQVGEPAKILINNKPASLNEHVGMNDYISILPAKKGKDGQLSVNRLLEQIDDFYVHIDNKKCNFKPLIKLNGVIPTLNLDIQNNDDVVTINPTLAELFKQFDINYSGCEILINGNLVLIDTVVNHMDNIILEDKTKENKKKEDISKGTADFNNNANVAINVIVNGEPITMNNKKSYVFVDIFDYYPFDLSKPKGVIVCKINNEDATYMEALSSGDVINIYWSNENI